MKDITATALLVGIVCGVACVIIWSNTGFYSWWVSKKNFKNFKASNPDSFRWNKFASCPACYGDYIYIKSSSNFNSNICKQCENEFWRSRM